MSNPADLTAQAAEWAAAQAVMRLFHCLDDSDYDGVAALFADDGVWMRMGEALTGPAAVHAAMAGRPATLKTRHLVTNMLAQRQNDGSVQARYTITVFDALHDAGGPAPLTLPGTIFACKDRLILINDGWLFAARHPSPIFKRR